MTIQFNAETGLPHFISQSADKPWDVGPVSDTAMSLIAQHQDAALALLAANRTEDLFGTPQHKAIVEERDAVTLRAAIRCAAYVPGRDRLADQFAIEDYSKGAEDEELKQFLALRYDLRQVLADAYLKDDKSAVVEAPTPAAMADMGALLDAHRKAMARCDELADGPDEVFDPARKVEQAAAVAVAACYWRDGLSDYQRELLDDYRRVAEDGAREGSLSYLLAMPREMVLVLAEHYQSIRAQH